MTQTQTTISIDTTSTDDVIARGKERSLPCKLTEFEFNEISKQRVQREAERDQLVDELAIETKRRKEQIEKHNGEIAKMGRELRANAQDRTVKCNEAFRRDLDGTPWVVVIRTDTWTEVERRPATPLESNRYLPGTEPAAMNGSGKLLDKARAAQAAEDRGGDGEDDLPDLDGDDEDPADDEEQGASASEPPPPLLRFRKDGTVTWSSSARGVTTTRTGAVDLVVPAGKSPASFGDKYKRLKAVRQHESYVVDVEGELYHPVVSQLRGAKGAE